MAHGPDDQTAARGNDAAGEHEVVVLLEILDGHAVGILMPAAGTPTPRGVVAGHHTVEIRAWIVGIAKDRSAEAPHETHLIDRADVGAVADVIKGPQGADLFANAFGQGAGFDATSVKITELPAQGIGDRTTALHATFDTRAGPFEAVFVFIASGRSAGQIYAAAAKDKVDPDDILALARTMAQKMEAGR